MHKELRMMLIILIWKSHEFLRGYTEVFTKNVLKTKEFTYHILMGIINNKSLDLVNRDKDSSVGIMINQITVADFIE